MPLPKAPSKPASPFTLTDDVRARPIRGKASKPAAPVTEELEGSFQPDLLDPVRSRSADSNDSPATAPNSSTTAGRSGARAALLSEPAGVASAPVKPRRGSKSVGGSGLNKHYFQHYKIINLN